MKINSHDEFLHGRLGWQAIEHSELHGVQVTVIAISTERANLVHAYARV